MRGDAVNRERTSSSHNAPMSRSLLADAIGHHAWATVRLIDACAALTPEQLASTVPGTYGSILDTLRHLIGSDSRYLSILNDGRTAPSETDAMSLAELRGVMETSAAGWAELAAGEIDPDAVTVRRRADGSETRAPASIRLAQVLHHGTDHRSQICTALTQLGLEPPEIDVWDFGRAEGRVLTTPAG
jgi:uncharacterized damage-inducible protein DinB